MKIRYGGSKSDDATKKRNEEVVKAVEEVEDSTTKTTKATKTIKREVEENG